MTIVRLNIPTAQLDAAVSTYTTPRHKSIPTDALWGIGIVSILPALFWVAAIWFIGRLFGFEISATMLAIAGTVIAAFLGVICSALLAAD